MRSLGLDIGASRIGVAISDPLGLNASPLEVLSGLGTEELRSYVEEKRLEGVGRVVIGLPLTLRGKVGKQARDAREYAKAIASIADIEVVLWDERFSTVEAERRLREAGRDPRRKRVDAEAAAVILQSYLEYAGTAAGKEKENDV